MLLPAITRFGLESAPVRYATAARAIGLATSADGDEAACARLAAGLDALNAELGVPSPKAYGIDPAAWEAKLPLMAQQALASGSPANNPRVPGEAEIVSLYRAVFNANA
jgi:alcohol dehydrogenase class IV